MRPGPRGVHPPVKTGSVAVSSAGRTTGTDRGWAAPGVHLQPGQDLLQVGGEAVDELLLDVVPEEGRQHELRMRPR